MIFTVWQIYHSSQDPERPGQGRHLFHFLVHHEAGIFLIITHDSVLMAKVWYSHVTESDSYLFLQMA